MTIEEEGLPIAAPQAINDDDLKSLVRTLADRSAELTERVALLERGSTDKKASQDETEDYGDDEELSPPRVSFAATSTRLDIVPDEEKLKQEKCNSANDTVNARISLLEKRMEDYEDEKDIILLRNNQGEYQLAESTISLLITEHPLSIPFMFGVFSIALSISCLSLVLASSISKGTSRNRLGIPVGVPATTRAAQFLGKLLLDNE